MRFLQLMLIVAMFSYLSPSTAFPMAGSPADSLETVIEDLRYEGKYEEAAKGARSLLNLLLTESATKPYELADAKRLIATLDFAAALPDSAREELAEADRLSINLVETFNQGEYAAGKEYAQRQLEIRRKYLGKEHPDVANSLMELALFLQDLGDYESAEPLAREALAMDRKILGNEHPTVAISLDNLAGLLKVRGDYAGAEPLYRESLSITRSVHGNENLSIAITLNNLANLLQELGDYDGAEPLFRESLAMLRKFLGPEHVEVATTLNNLGGLLKARGDYAGAELLYRESLAMRRKLLGNEHPSVATGLNNLAQLLLDRGDYSSSEPLFRESLAMFRELLGDDHPNVALVMGNLANLLNMSGDYAGAELLYRESLAMYRKLLGEEHLAIARNLHNLANLLEARGDYAGAEPLYRESLEMYRTLLGEEHRNVAHCLAGLASVLKSRGDYAGAEPLFRESLVMRRKLLGDEHPDVARNLNNLALLLQARGNYAGAEPLLRESLAMLRRLLGDEHPDLATTLNNLAVLLQELGDFPGAEPLFRESLAMRRNLLGDKHPNVVNSLDNLASLLRVSGDYAGAETLLDQAAVVFDAARLRVGTGMERAAFNEKSPYPALAETRLRLGNEKGAWLAVERSQGRVLADLLLTTESRELSPAEADNEKALRLAVGDRQRQLEVYRTATHPDSTAEAQRRVENARTLLLEAEVALSSFTQQIVAKYPVTEGQAFPLKRIQAVLDKSTAIIGWLDVEIKKDESASWGYVIRNRGQVSWIQLPDLSASTSGSFLDLARACHDALVSSGLSASSMVSAFSAVHVQPLLAALEDVNKLIVIPSGVMATIPLEGLVDEKNRRLVDLFTVSYAPSATIYTWLREQATENQTTTADRILLLGDPPFCDAQRQAMESESGEQPMFAFASPSRDVEILRGIVVGNAESLAALPRLEGTRIEVQTIADAAFQPTVLLGPEANEQKLVRMAQEGELASYRAIHLATHAMIDDERPDRCCLVLSQVNLPAALEAAMQGERIYDGRLTVQEILQEWDLDADLVTLSACETALGKNISGEGMVGFSYAFLQAGARSLLVSLWKVDDRATSLLMTRFYENLWQRKLGKANALREAKRWLREYKNELGTQIYGHPYYWSAFILIGE